MSPMLARVSSAAVLGVEAYKIDIEVDVSGGLPSVTIVGLPDTAVQESRERVRTAIKHAGFPFPSSRIVINLAPADVRKEGPAFDLPIALAILAAQGVIAQERLKELLVCAELALDGSLRHVRGAINIGLFASQEGYKRIIVPPDNAAEVAVLTNLTVLAPQTLAETVAYLQGQVCLQAAKAQALKQPVAYPNLQDVKGQTAAKRALEIAAAGAHNLLMSGPPGAGKTMLAKRLPGLLPALPQAEAIEVTRIHSTAGLLKDHGLITHPPFRAPHHTVSDAGLIGGGNIPKPGEVSLAHRGVLFLDEFPEFSRPVLEVLRQPLEDGIVTISRARASLTFPARFMLIASQNPCPCGHYGDPERSCHCSPRMRRRYQERISGPLLDRLDLRIDVPRLAADDLLKAVPGESSVDVAIRVRQVRMLSTARQGTANAYLIGQALREHCHLNASTEALAKSLITQLALSARGFDRLLRVARTIADLAAAPSIGETHLAEAMRYRGTHSTS